MAGQGSPHRSSAVRPMQVGRGRRRAIADSLGRFVALWSSAKRSGGFLRMAIALTWLALAVSGARAQEQIETRIRVVWGGGPAKPWVGSLRVQGGTLSNLHDLGLAANSAGSKEFAPDQIQISSPAPLSFDGFDIAITAAAGATVDLEFREDVSSPAPSLHLELPIEQIASLTDSQDWEMDNLNNRLLIRRVPGDQLRVTFSRESLVFAPDEEFQFSIESRLTVLEPNSSLRMRLQIIAARTATEVWSTQETITTDDFGKALLPAATSIQVPEEEGVYDLVISIQRRGRIDVPTIRRNSNVAERRVQFVVIDSDPAESDDEQNWEQEKSIDSSDSGWRTWTAKIPGMSLIPGLETKPLTNSTPQRIEFAERSMLQLAPGQWQAYPIPIDAEGKPHLLEVEFPNNLPQTLGISIVEPNAAGEVVPIGVDSGVYIPESIRDEAPTIARHRLVFWPRTKAPLVLLVNHRRDGPAVFGRIHVFSGPERLPPASFSSAPSERLFAACFDKPLFCENFSAGGALDPVNQQVLDDWSKFYLATIRLTEYLKYAGYNGAVICVARDGSTLYPSSILSSTPRFDTGIFFTTGQDPIRKDVLEMMFRIFDREGLQLVPAVHFSGRTERLEQLQRGGGPAAQGILLEFPGGIKSKTHYNPLHPQVQDTMRATVQELALRYSQHASFQGVAIQLAADSYGILPDERWAVDAQTLNRFRRTAFNGSEPEQLRQFENATAMLRNAELKQRWLEWRAQELSRLYTSIYDLLKAERSDARLWLLTADMFQGRTAQAMLQPSLPTPENHPVITASLTTGIDAPLYRRDPGIVLFRPQRYSGSNNLNEQAGNIQMASPDVDGYFRGADSVRGELSSGAQLYCEPLIMPLPSFNEQSPFGKDVTHTVLHTHAAAAGFQQRQLFAHTLAVLDAHDIVNGGWMMPLGQEEFLSPLIEVYRELPRQPFQKVTPRSKNGTQPIIIRAARTANETMFYVVNDSPWPVRASVEYSARMDARLRTLGSREYPAAFPRTNRWLWSIELEPYDVVAAAISDPEAEILNWEVQLPNDVRRRLEEQINRVRALAVAATRPVPLATPGNLNFEVPSRGIEIPGWEFKTGPGLSVTLDRRDKNSGSSSMRITSARDPLWVRSEAFPPPQTGRLYALMRLKTRDAQQQPMFRVVLDVKDRFYEARTVGRGAGVTPLPDSWGNGSDFLFAFEQLPVQNLEKLHLGFDLMDKGDVWIDDIQLFEIWFTADEKNALHLESTAAEDDLEHSMNVRNAQQFLEGFWPRFLLAYGEVPAPRDERAAAAPAPEEPSKPKRTTMDQMRELVPKVPLKNPFRR